MTAITELEARDSDAGESPLWNLLEEQRHLLWEAQSIVDCVIAALKGEFGRDWPAALPDYPMSLRLVRQTLENVAENLELAQGKNWAEEIEAEGGAA